MFIVGFDLGKRKSQLCVEDETGKVLAELRIDTTPEAIAKALRDFPGAKVLLEASTSAEWIARVLEKLGCTVIVADPRFWPMFAQRNKKVKNDRRDARALADALRMNAYRAAHRRSDEARRIRAQIIARRQLLDSRTSLINCVRSICEQEGIVIRSCQAESFVDAVEEVLLKERWIFDAIGPLVSQIARLSDEIEASSAALEKEAKANPVTRNLQTVRGVGPITSLAFFSSIDDVKRFESGRQVTAYLGLVPGEQNSGDSKRPPGAITKCGDPLVRSYLVEAAFSHTNKHTKDSPLKRWRDKIAGPSEKKPRKKKAAVAVARRLARILWAMWRDNKPYDEARTAPGAVTLPKGRSWSRRVVPPSKPTAAAAAK